jgi:hypothetical protein
LRRFDATNRERRIVRRQEGLRFGEGRVTELQRPKEGRQERGVKLRREARHRRRWSRRLARRTTTGHDGDDRAEEHARLRGDLKRIGSSHGRPQLQRVFLRAEVP